MTAARWDYQQDVYLDALCPECGHEFAICADIEEIDGCPGCHWDGTPREQLPLFGEDAS